MTKQEFIEKKVLGVEEFAKVGCKIMMKKVAPKIKQKLQESKIQKAEASAN